MKKLNKLVAILVAMAMVLALSVVSAFADPDPKVNTTTKHVVVSKKLAIAQGLAAPEDFSFTVTAKTVDGNAYVPATEAVPATQDTEAIPAQPANMPTIQGATAATNGLTDTDKDGFIIKNATIDFDVTYPHAGVYVYEIAESIPSPKTAGVTYDETSKYTVTLRVNSNGQVTDIVVTDKDNNKVNANDPTDNEPNDGDDGLSDAVFNNSYTKTADETPTGEEEDEDTDETESKASAVITKTVDGTYGDTTLAFPFELTVTLPATAPNQAIKVYTVDANDNRTEVSAANGKYSFSLKHDEHAVIENAPVGTYYAVTEKLSATTNAAYAKYAGAVNTEENGGQAAAKVIYNAENKGHDVETGSLLIGEAANNKAAYTNKNTDDETTTPTGILISNLPYIALALVAIGGLVAYVVVRRRQDDEA